VFVGWGVGGVGVGRVVGGVFGVGWFWVFLGLGCLGVFMGHVFVFGGEWWFVGGDPTSLY